MKIFNNRKSRIGRHVFLAALAIASIITAPRAQLPAPVAAKQSTEDRVALYQALLDLQNPWTVMCVAAHPDDEDGTSLIVMRRKFGAHTVSLFSTFGEGGQNAIGPELYEALGAIRARETMAAAEIQGSEPAFLGLKDFGYSKSFDETFQKWGHDEALRRMVLHIRNMKPDVIITNHSVTTNDHGHHQATARLVVEAFDDAADPTKFPEQLKDGATVWQVQRLFVRARGNQAQTDNAPVVTIDPNEQDPIRGTTFAEEALSALQKHATQGPWPKTVAQMASRFTNSPDGRLPIIRYRLVREAKDAASLSARDSHNFLDGLRLNGEIAKQLSPPTIDGKPLIEFVDQREKVLDALIEASKKHIFGEEPKGTKDFFADLRRTRMLVRLNKSLAVAGGISAALISANDVLIPGESVSFDLAITNKGADPIHVDLAALGDGTNDKGALSLSSKHHPNSAIPPGETVKIPTTYKLSEKAPLTVPHAAHLYDQDFAGIPVAAAAFVELKGARFPIIVGRLSDVAPPIEIADLSPSLVVLTGGKTSYPPLFVARIVNHESIRTSGRLVISSSNENGKQTSEAPFSLAPREAIQLKVPTTRTMIVNMDAPARMAREITLRFSIARPNDKPADHLIQYVVPVVHVDAQVSANLRVAYIRGFDFSLPNALNALGVESKELSVDEVKTADLSKFTSVIVDNRVYESQPELIAANQKLLDYANAGGTLIVFYHKSDEWNPDQRRNRPQLAPYKLILGNERITDENAPITFLEPDHPLLNVPNKMGQEDFAGWIQERGLYYPREWDPQFHALLQSNDPGEAPLKGGLLAADYGGGHYIYTSMVWYRELRGGVPGAYRMLANMISYGRTGK